MPATHPRPLNGPPARTESRSGASAVFLKMLVREPSGQPVSIPAVGFDSSVVSHVRSIKHSEVDALLARVDSRRHRPQEVMRSVYALETIRRQSFRTRSRGRVHGVSEESSDRLLRKGD